MQGFWNLIGKSGEGPGKDFQYDVGEKASSTFDSKSIWTLHHGKRRLNGNIVSVFICDAKVSSPDEFQLAKTSHKRLKTLRHPNIIKYLDGFESESLVYVVTEAVIPLAAFLDEEDGRNANLIAWGLYQVINGLSFLINDGNLLHENVNIFSIFVGLDGEWKLGGVEYMHTSDTTVSGKLPCLCRYDPPEGKENKKKEKWSSDAWGLGCLVWEIYNGTLQKAGDLKVVNKIPKSLMLPYCDLVHANPKKRTNPKDFLQRCLQPGQFFDCDFLKANLFLNEIQIKDVNEQKEFFISLDKSLDTFPKQFCVHKVLPQLLNAFEFGAAGSAVLSPLFKVGLLLDEAAYQTKIVPCIIKLFSSNDRATRIQLLQQMEKFVKHLQPAVVDNQIFACVATGFGDTLPAMREQTVKAMLLLAPKLSPKTMNNQLLRYFSKLQMDEQPGIRTNTTICLGKIAEFIPAETRQKMLAPGFVRSLHDPFPHARNAGVMAMSATSKYYSPTDIATKILPALCAVAVDQEKSVRDNAFKVIKQFISILEKHSTDPENAAADLSKEGEQGSTWTGWAVSSFTSRFYQNTGGAAVQGKAEETTETQKPTTTEGSTLPVSNGVESQKEESGAMSDHSNYDDAFGEEYWENKQKGGNASAGEDSDNSFSSMKKDLLAVRKSLEEVTTKVAVLDTASDHDSDSDYGDWGAGGGDSWGKDDNDDWGSLDAPTSKKANKAKTKTSTLSAEDGWGKDDNDDWGSFDDPKTKHTTNKPEASMPIEQTKPGGFAAQPFSDTPTKDKKLASSLFETDSQSEFDSFASTAVKEKSNLPAEKSTMPVQKDPPSVASASPEDGWGADEWDEDGQGWDDEQKKKEEAKERRKQELQRKREEKKQQRELANKDKKAKPSGAMKLGAVKKNPMGDG